MQWERSKQLRIKNAPTFREVLQSVLRCKSVFDRLEPEELRKARTRSNPFETIRGAFFLNRAAMKMANMDAICDFMFTNPRDRENRPLVKPNEPLYFADVCAGDFKLLQYVNFAKNNVSQLHPFVRRPWRLFRVCSLAQKVAE